MNLDTWIEVNKDKIDDGFIQYIDDNRKYLTKEFFFNYPAS